MSEEDKLENYFSGDKYLPVNSKQLEKVRQQLYNKKTGVGGCDNYKCQYQEDKKCNANKEQLAEIGCFKGFKEKKMGD